MPSNVVVIGLLSVLLLGCTEDKQAAEAAPGRFAAVKKNDAAARKAERTFCEQTYPKSGDGARSFVTPPERAVPAAKVASAQASGGWRWVNLWATWCGPCVEEMPLLGRWRDTLKADGIDIGLELWSVDEDEGELSKWLASKELPGRVRWIRDQEALGPALESFGVDKNSAIPIHLFVDAQDRIRCVRVGAVHNQDYGAIKTILADG